MCLQSFIFRSNCFKESEILIFLCFPVLGGTYHQKPSCFFWKIEQISPGNSWNLLEFHFPKVVANLNLYDFISQKLDKASKLVYQLIIIYVENQTHHQNHQSHLMKYLVLLQYHLLCLILIYKVVNFTFMLVY